MLLRKFFEICHEGGLSVLHASGSIRHAAESLVAGEVWDA